MRKVPQQTQERLAACAAVGLGYWSGHPRAGWAWAVDDAQQAHAVEIDRKRGRARRVYEPARAWAAAKVGPWADWTTDDWQAALARPDDERNAA